jgi:hypothetical protein
MNETAATLDAYAGVLKQLQTAHAALVAAATAKPTPDDVLKKAVGTLTDVLSDLQALEAALTTKRS